MHLNGRMGQIVAYVHDTGRFRVEDQGIKGIKAVQPENLVGCSLPRIR